MLINFIRQRLKSPTTSIFLFFGITLVYTWFFWWLAVIIGEPYGAPVVTILHALGGIGPAIAGIILVQSSKDAEIRLDYWRRVFDFKRIPLQGYLAILLFAPLTSLLAVGWHWLAKGDLFSFDHAASLLAQPARLILLAPSLLVFGPLPEELGWRGFALDRLDYRKRPLTASLLVAFFWCLWHIPLFFIPGTYQNQLGIGTTSFWLFFLALIPESILMTWLYRLTRRSTLSAILFHFMTNFTGEFLDLTEPIAQTRLVFAFLAALGIVLWWLIQPQKTQTRRSPQFGDASE